MSEQRIRDLLRSTREEIKQTNDKYKLASLEIKINLLENELKDPGYIVEYIKEISNEVLVYRARGEDITNVLKMAELPKTLLKLIDQS